MNSVLFMDQIEDLYLLSGKEGVVIYFLVEGSDVTQYLKLIMLVIKAWYVTKQCVLPDQNFDFIQHSEFQKACFFWLC